MLAFGLESSVFPLLIPSIKIKKYRIVGFVLIYMTSHVKAGSQAEDFQERGCEEGPKRGK